MSSNSDHSILHQKALEIVRLSQRVSEYLIHDLSSLQSNGSENPYVYFTGDIIRQTDSLALGVHKAENQLFRDDRIQYAQSLKRVTRRIYRSCEALERSDSNGKDFLILLRRELKKFRGLQKNWMMTL